MAMAISRFFLASIVVLAFLGIASAQLEDLKPEDNTVKRIQAIIFCRRPNGELIKTEGATARVSCFLDVKVKPFTVISPPTKDGYFYMDLEKLVPTRYNIKRDCKVYLNEPAPGDCTVPTNDNKGIEGAPLDKPPRKLNEDTTLLSVGPFVYVPPVM